MMDGFSRRASGLWVRKAEPRPKFCSLYASNQLSGFAGKGYGRDPNFASVSLLLHMDGPAGGTTFTDHSSNALSVSANGNAQISTLEPRWPTGAVLLDGTGDSLGLPSNAVLSLGTGDFTVEFWMRSTASGNNTIIAEADTHGIYMNSGIISVFDGASHNGVITVNDGDWHFVLWRRSGTAQLLYVDGIQDGSWTSATDFNFSGVTIGFEVSTGYYTGRFDDFRITKGVARENIVPDAPFPNQ